MTIWKYMFMNLDEWSTWKSVTENFNIILCVFIYNHNDSDYNNNDDDDDNDDCGDN